MRHRAFDAEERALWEAAMRDVAPLRPKPRRKPPALPSLTPAPPALPRRPAAPRVPLLVLPAPPGGGLDRRTAQKLKRGQLPVEARLDLHGRTQIEAHGALDDFLTDAVVRGWRCVLVITGKGGNDGNGRIGVLREAVPRWLDEPINRARVLAHTPAQPRAGGGGALYVLVRRQR